MQKNDCVNYKLSTLLPFVKPKSDLIMVGYIETINETTGKVRVVTEMVMEFDPSELTVMEKKLYE